MTEGESAENTAGGAENTAGGAKSTAGGAESTAEGVESTAECAESIAGGAVPKTLIYGQIWNKKVKKYGIYLTERK